MGNAIYVYPNAVDEVRGRNKNIVINQADIPYDVARFKKATPYIFISAVFGTSPTLDVVIQAKYDNKWITIYSFPQYTSIGDHRYAPFEIIEKELRHSFVVGGTTSVFTITYGYILKS